MKRNIMFAVFFCIIIVCRGFEINENTSIVCSDNESESVKFAASELRDYIFKTSGIKLGIAAMKPPGTKAIVVRKGAYGEEEWNIVCKDGNLVFSGGYPRGVLYGVYEFIEKFLGCRFLTKEAEYVPKIMQKKLTVPDNLCLAGKPDFDHRFLQPGEGIWQTQAKFYVKHKFNGVPVTREEGRIKHGWYSRTGWRGGHNYYRFSKDFPSGHDDYFSMSESGKRLKAVNTSGPGQICTTHPEVRAFIIDKFRKVISNEAKEANETGRPKSIRFALCANDNREKCVCPRCLALEKKYGFYSGVGLELLNNTWSELRKEFPDLTLETYIYTFTELPPNDRIKALPGVILTVCQLGDEFMGTACRRDSLRPLSHPNNAKARELLLKWSQKGGILGIHDYWILYRQNFPIPFTNISSIPEILRFYKKIGVKHFMSETQALPYYCSSNFHDLKIYLGAKLLSNTSLDEKVLIEEFLRLYYGPAADAMRKQLNYLESRMKEEPGNLGSIASGNKKYLDKKFFDASEKIFAEAEKAAGSDAVLLRRIGQERINYDFALINMSHKLGMTINRPAILKRLRQNLEWVYKRYVRETLQEKYASDLNSLIESLALQLPIPERFAKEKAYDFAWNKLSPIPYRNATEKVADPDAAGGKAIRLMKGTDIKNLHDRPLEFGLYSYVDKKHVLKRVIPKEKLPRDEKYHWYKVGTSRLWERTQVWIHWTWMLGQTKPGNSIFDPLFPEAKYEIWISLKLQGPAYVPGSKKPDAVFLDRIIFLEKPLQERQGV